MWFGDEHLVEVSRSPKSYKNLLVPLVSFTHSPGCRVTVYIYQLVLEASCLGSRIGSPRPRNTIYGGTIDLGGGRYYRCIDYLG